MKEGMISIAIVADNISTQKEFFKASGEESVRGLLEIGCFEIVTEKEADGPWLHRSGFVDTMRSDGKK